MHINLEQGKILMELDRDSRPIWLDGEMGCKVGKSDGAFHTRGGGGVQGPSPMQNALDRITIRVLSLYSCPVAGCSFSSSRRGQVTRHGKFRHRSTDDPLRGNVTDPKYWPPRDRLMHLLLWSDKRHAPKGGCSEEKDTNGLNSKRKSGAHFICVKRPGSSAKRRRSGNYNRKSMGKLF